MQCTLLQGDSRELLPTLPAQSVQCVVTSPPYWRQRVYTDDAREIGLEPTWQEYVAALREVFTEVWRVLRDDGVLWLNLGDTYSFSGKGGGKKVRKGLQSLKSQVPNMPIKNLLGLPWRVVFALQEEGWILRQEVIWHKTFCKPESVKDRPSRTHEQIFLLSKSEHYYYDYDAIAEPTKAAERPQYRRAQELAAASGITEAHIAAIRAVGLSDVGRAKELQSGAGKNSEDVRRLADEAKTVLGGYTRELLTRETKNASSVWNIAPNKEACEHFAPMPEEACERCILAGSRVGDTVLDPFAGSGTTGLVARRLQRDAVLIELGAEYSALQSRRTDNVQLAMLDVL